MNRPPYSVYLITHKLPRNQSKQYVGLTIRTLQARLQAHRGTAARKGKKVAKGSLGEAMRIEFQRNPRSKAFDIALLSTHRSLNAVRRAEIRAIEKWGTVAPYGYNLMRGGSSVGGPSNSKSVTVEAGDKRTTFESLAALCRVMWTSGGYSPDGEAMPSSNPGFSPGPAAKAITVGGVLIIVVVIILLPVGI
jgi:hypothetical protein